MIESHFEITVSKNGIFYFRINGIRQALCHELEEKYPTEDGYRIRMVWVECNGSFVWDNGEDE